jgi:hypothetical protein
MSARDDRGLLSWLIDRCSNPNRVESQKEIVSAVDIWLASMDVDPSTVHIRRRFKMICSVEVTAFNGELISIGELTEDEAKHLAQSLREVLSSEPNPEEGKEAL